jgi:hypothetical protein
MERPLELFLAVLSDLTPREFRPLFFPLTNRGTSG